MQKRKATSRHLRWYMGPMMGIRLVHIPTGSFFFFWEGGELGPHNVTDRENVTVWYGYQWLSDWTRLQWTLHGSLLLQYSAIQHVFDMTFYDFISNSLQLLASLPCNHLLPTYVTSASSFFLL